MKFLMRKALLAAAMSVSVLAPVAEAQQNVFRHPVDYSGTNLLASAIETAEEVVEEVTESPFLPGLGEVSLPEADSEEELTDDFGCPVGHEYPEQYAADVQRHQTGEDIGFFAFAIRNYCDNLGSGEETVSYVSWTYSPVITTANGTFNDSAVTDFSRAWDDDFDSTAGAFAIQMMNGEGGTQEDYIELWPDVAPTFVDDSLYIEFNVWSDSESDQSIFYILTCDGNSEEGVETLGGGSLSVPSGSVNDLSASYGLYSSTCNSVRLYLQPSSADTFYVDFVELQAFPAE